MTICTLTPRLRAAAQLAIALKSPELDEETTTELQTCVNSDWETPQTISHTLVAHIARIIREHATENGLDEDLYELRELLRGSTLVHEAPKQREKSPELQAILERARIDQENKEYARMVSGVSSSNDAINGTAPASIGRELKAASQLSLAAFNVVLSLVAVFAAVYYFGDAVSNDASMKTLMGLAGVLIVAIAEGWFFMRDWLVVHEKPTMTTSKSNGHVTNGQTKMAKEE
ncbi:hypothetical protein SmJEL517_g02191 [Synchytrium microbalum]|uniref:Endoplasmic reticulum-based factor for assembly of V-ATPase-domain-containing protein n=1 Tax=Synchytrium microbalum TaxID=1806994 RepID=A0A507C332_9FUNG|nr:uncharacterized protein SmJEL517_g02191 [Synchytrium microbalum]TPX35537.1 hypothetical protein SmJEL517_g02191 [Synchytrium microbalum]